jgi:hypothetical protein
MAEKRVLCDKTEVVLKFNDSTDKNKIKIANLAYDQITSITIEDFYEFRLFRKVPSERILVRTNRLQAPIIYTKKKDKQFFDEYKQDLAKFAKDNRITFYDNTSKK